MKPCPPLEQLQCLLADVLPQPERSALEIHIEQCPRCQAALERLTDDSLVRPERPIDSLAKTPLLELREEAQKPTAATSLNIPKLAAPANAGDQIATGSHCLEDTPTTDLQASENESTDELTFLTASEKLGSLGRIGHYEVLQVLGRGGFGIVLRVFDEVLQRVVAIKVLSPAIAATSPARKLFLREARAAAKIRHDHMVQIYNVEAQPLPYLVMEFIPGETLQQRIDRTGPLDVPEIVQIGRQLAEGLAAAHATGLIHRDIKPANVLIETDTHQRVKITDFGLARTADDASLTQSGLVAGTPQYMSPEQARGDHLDHRTDLFSLGSVLYVLCTGRPPFRAANTLAVLKRVAEDAPQPIQEVIPEVSPWLCDIIGRLHAKDPRKRFQTAAEVAKALAAGAAQPAPAAPAMPRHRRVALIAAAALVLAGTVGLGPWASGLFRFQTGPDELAEFKDKSTVNLMPPADDAKLKQAALAVQKQAHEAAQKQVDDVAAQLKKRNPGFDGIVTSRIEKGVVTEMAFVTDKVKDISPVQKLTGLCKLDCSGTTVNYQARGQLANLMPLKGMKLTELICDATRVASLAPLRGMKLTHFSCVRTQVSDLTPLQGMSLTFVGCRETKVSNLAPLKGMKLTKLNVSRSQVSHLAPLSEMDVLSLDCSHTKVFDLTPLKSTNLSELYCRFTPVADLEPLRGMKLTYLDCQGTQVSNLAPLEGMPLKVLYCATKKIDDLSVLRGLPLDQLYCDFKADRDAKILRAIPTLNIINSKSATEFWKQVNAAPP